MYYFIKFIVNIAFHVAFNVHFEGRNNIPDGETVIYASNHRSNADPPLIGCSAKGKFAFMAKEELFKNSFFAWLIRSLGAFPVSRGKGDTGVLDTAVERLESGRSLIIFPEGTRSKDGKVHRGHSGAAVISARSQKKIVPVGIVFGEKLKFRTKITVKYGKPINPTEYIDNSDEPNPRQLVKLKNCYMEEIKKLVEGMERSQKSE
ncbi:MAG: 1-acyl-sn-glycerol-3-phosphate acyltransferase [Ruminococcus sp.]|nr:1-acyl-sn-glycerol-3-phosphate acyltransferase [Ruminococcus sp.]